MESISGLNRALVQAGRLSLAEVEKIQQDTHARASTFVYQLIQSQKMTALEVTMFASRAFGFPWMDVDLLNTEHLPLELIDKDVALSRRILALHRRGNKLQVLVSDPTQSSVFHAITFKTGLGIEPIVAEDDKLDVLLRRLYANAAAENLYETVDDEALASDDTLSAEEVVSDDDQDQIPAEDDAPVVKFLHQILLDAIKQEASDIHFEPYEKFYRIRYRIDGELREVSRPPGNIKERLAARIKVLSRLDISERRVPQDGRMKLQIGGGRRVDFRVSTLPTLFGEKIVMRILERSAASLDIEALGLEDSQKNALLEAIHRPYGMVLVTGPTGSGKTVSLYTCLNILNKPSINISTAEDPAEINLPGVNQISLNEKAGLTFSSCFAFFSAARSRHHHGWRNSGFWKRQILPSKLHRRAILCFLLCIPIQPQRPLPVF